MARRSSADRVPRVVPPKLGEKIHAMAPLLLGGRGDLSIDGVAAAAGIPRATLYRYFSGPDELLAFMAGDIITGFFETARAASQGGGAVADRLERGLVAAMSHEINPSFLRALVSTGTLVPRLVGEMIAGGFTPVRELLLAGRHSGELTFDDVDVAISVLFGALLMLAMSAEGPIRSEEARATVRTVLNGFRARSPVPALQ